MPTNAVNYYGSICLTELVELAKKGHPCFSRSDKNGKVYVNFQMWVNDEPDQYKNHVQIKLNPKKEERDAVVAKFGKGYFGNAKKSEYQEGAPVDSNASDLDISGFPGASPNAAAGNAAPLGSDVSEKLPF